MQKWSIEAVRSYFEKERCVLLSENCEEMKCTIDISIFSLWKTKIYKINWRGEA